MAQERPSNPLPNTVWVGADGKFESDPDTALVQFGISAQEEKLQDASQKASQQAEQIRQLLRSNGIDPKDAQFSRFSTNLVYDYKKRQAEARGLSRGRQHQHQAEGFLQDRPASLTVWRTST